MTPKEQRIQQCLRDWMYTLHRVAQLEAEVREMQISITPTYELSGISGSGGDSNKIERHYIKKEKKELELERKRKRITIINDVLESDYLSRIEKAVIGCLMNNHSLKTYAKEHGIYKSYIYKVKDKAIRKIARLVDDNTF